MDEIEMEQMAARQRIRKKHDNPAMVQALQRFTRLRSLHIDGDVSLRKNSPVMQGLSGLMALTRLSVSSVLRMSNLEQLRHLPAQLRELELRELELRELELKDTLRHSERITFCSLSHLAALTCLHTDASVSVVENVVLPPNLVWLCVRQC